MGLKNLNDKLKRSETRLTKGINIPPQQNVPKMPPVQPPKKTK